MTWLACGGLPTCCRRPGHFLLLAQEKITTEMVAMPKEKAPRMTRLPSVGRKVRGRVTGFFDRTSVSCRKTGRIPAATLRAFLHPPAAVTRGPQEPEPKLAAVVFSRAPAPSPQPSPTRGEGEVGARRERKSEAKAKADAKRGSALSPLRFGRVAQRYEVPAVWPPMGVPPQPSSSARAYPNTMLRAFALKAIFFGLLSKRS